METFLQKGSQFDAEIGNMTKNNLALNKISKEKLTPVKVQF